MKKIIIVFAAMAAILASCSKSEPEAGQKNVRGCGGINIDLSVSNLGDEDSKALVKTDWASGDQLLIWFDENAGEKPDLVIKYDGSSWEQDGSAEVSGNTPSSANGYMKVLYNNTLIVTAKDPYTFNSGTSTLSGKIQTWTFLMEIQVVVKGISLNKAGDANTFVSGIANADGAAFVFASCTSYDTESTFTFSLSKEFSNHASAGRTPTKPEFVDLGLNVKWATHNVGASKPEEYGYYFFWGSSQGYIRIPQIYTPGVKTLVKDASKINALKVTSKSFASECWGKAEDGEKFDKGFCWENTPHTDGIYSDSNMAVFTKYVIQKKASTYGKDGFYDDKQTLDPEDDAARKYCGEGYRMPTNEDFLELDNNTNKTWVENYNGTGIGGMLLTSTKPGYTDKSVFFPAAGNGSANLNSCGISGSYWSGSLGLTECSRAYRLQFNNTGLFQAKYTNFRYFGFSVRPVSD